jgi:hypothetical protein
MKNIVKIAALTVIAVSVSGCAGVLSSVTNANMDEKTAQAKTAEYFGAPEGQVKISNFSKNLIDTTYRAYYKGTMYNCNIQYGGVECKKPGSS